MDRFVVREPRSNAEYPQGNQMIALPANGVGNNMIPPETMYFSGPFASEFPDGLSNMSAQRNISAQHNMGVDQNMKVQHNMGVDKNMRVQDNNMGFDQNMRVQHNMGVDQNMRVQHNMGVDQNMRAQHNMGVDQNMRALHNMGVDQNMRVQHNMGIDQNMRAQHNMGAHQNPNALRIMGTSQNMGIQFSMGAHQNLSSLRNLNGQQNVSVQQSLVAQDTNQQSDQTFGHNIMAGQGSVSGIDPNYLAGYTDNRAQFIVSGQQIQRNATPINCFRSEYQNRSFNGIDRNKHKIFGPQQVCSESSRAALPKPQPQMPVRVNNTEDTPKRYPTSQPKKANELDLLRNDIQNQIMTRADKLKALYKTGPRAFSGPVEKVLKWHKSLQEIGVLIFYEIVAKCVSVRPGEYGSKVLVVRDDSGPAMEVVFYEIDFLLPELKPPCTVRIIGRMMSGTCRLQAFNIRVATGDDVATLPRRAAVAAHHIAKLCKEYGSQVA